MKAQTLHFKQFETTDEAMELDIMKNPSPRKIIQKIQLGWAQQIEVKQKTSKLNLIHILFLTKIIQLPRR